MGKIQIAELADILVQRNGLNKRDAKTFVSAIFDIVKEGLAKDKIVKIRGFGTFKIISVEARESVNVNTGERLVISGHSKVTFTPDSTMKEMVNKPFSQFETVVLNDGVEFADVPSDVAESEPEDAEEREQEIESLASTSVLQAEPSESPIDIQTSVELTGTPEPEQTESPEPEQAESPEPEQPEPSEPEQAEPSELEQAESSEPEQAESSEPEQVGSAEPDSEIVVSPQSVDVGSDSEPEVEEVQVADGSSKSGENVGRWWAFSILSILLAVAAAYGGYRYGVYETADKYSRMVSQQQKELDALKKQKIEEDMLRRVYAADDSLRSSSNDSVAALVRHSGDSVVSQSVEADSEKPVEENLQSKTPEKKESPAGKQDQYEAKDSRVRTGAYRIVGTAKTVTVAEGESVEQISRRHLGPGMECYVEVYNGLSQGSQLKKGATLKIPRLELKKKKK